MPEIKSALTTKLIVLTRACCFPENKTVNIYTDCSNAFGVVHDMLENYFWLPLASLFKRVKRSQWLDPDHLPKQLPIIKTAGHSKTNKDIVLRLVELQKGFTIRDHTQKESVQLMMTTLLLSSSFTQQVAPPWGEKPWQQESYSVNSQSHLWSGPIGKPLVPSKCPTPLLECTPINSLGQKKWCLGLNSSPKSKDINTTQY